MQWLIKEQVEEVASMNDLFTVVRRAKEDMQYAEQSASADLGGDAEPHGSGRRRRMTSPTISPRDRVR